MSSGAGGLIHVAGCDHRGGQVHADAAVHRLGGFRIEGYWRGVDTVKDIMEASAEFAASG